MNCCGSIKKNFLVLSMISFFSSFLPIGASYCPRCVKIESERAKEQVLDSLKSEYYEEKMQSSPENAKITQNQANKDLNRQSEIAMEDLKNSKVLEVNEKEKPLVVQRDPSYSTLFNIFDTKNFLSVFSGPFTLFIPTNNAFQHLEIFTTKDFVTPDFDDRLSMITSYHVVSEQILNKNFKDGQKIKTIGGYNLTLKSEGNTLYVNDAKVVKIQAVGNQGIIYVVDKVLIPLNLTN